MNNDFSLSEKNAELIYETDIKEDTIVAIPRFSLETAANKVEKDKTSFVKKGIFDRVRPEEVKVIKREIEFRPFWKMICAYGCKFLKRNKYDIDVNSDVEAVCIDGKEKQVSAKHLKLSDIISKVSLSGGVYGVNMVLGLEDGVKIGVSKLLGDRDLSISKKTKVTVDGVIERVVRCINANLFFDANKGIEDKDTFNKLGKINFEKTSSANLKKKGKVLDVQVEKKRIIDEAKRKVIKEPEDSPRRILEQIFSIKELKLVYVPFYSFILKRSGEEKRIIFNSVTEELIK